MRRTIEIGIIALGVLLLLSAIHVLPQNVSLYFSIYWPGLLVLWGLEEFFNHLMRGKRNVVFPAILTFLGVFLLLRNLSVPGLNMINPWLLFLALVLIYSGATALFGFSSIRFIVNRKSRKWTKNIKKNMNYSDWQGNWDWEDKPSGTPSFQKSFGGFPKIGDYRYGDEPWQLSHLYLKQLAGTIRINLGTATIPDGETPIEISGGAGEVRISIPEGLAVNIRTEVFIGEVRLFDKKIEGVSLQELSYISEGYEDAIKKVRILVRLKAGEVRVQRVI